MPLLSFTLVAAILSLLALIACIALVGLAFYVWHYRRTYTRERFAFYALGSCLAVTIGVLGAIAGDAPTWQQLIIVFHYIREGELPSTALSPVLSASMVISLWGMYAFAYLMFSESSPFLVETLHGS